jgi:TATA-binding protein-associated factor Taf7
MNKPHLISGETLKTISQGALGAMTFGAYHQYTTNKIMELNNEKVEIQHQYFMDKMENQHKKEMIEIENQHKKERIEMEKQHKLLHDKLEKLEKIVSQQKSWWWSL